jgi:hypothetical protein
MTLSEIVKDCEAAYGARYRVSKAKILQFVNTVQQVAFNRPLLAFLWWQDYLTVYQELTFSAIGTPFVAADVGKTVTATGGTGTLRSYDAARLTAQVETSDTLSGALAVSGGTGAAAIASQAVSKGPYSWAGVQPSFGSLTPFTNPAGFRRVLGVTRRTDAEIFGTVVPRELTDYGFSPLKDADRYLLENVRKYDVQRVLSFIEEPDTAANTYRWVGYIRPPLINNDAAADDANLLIPSEFHETVVKEGVGLLADRTTYGDRVPEQVLADILGPYWEAMQQPYTAMGKNADMTSEGTL